jgi:DNA mismatch repair protein MutL
LSQFNLSSEPILKNNRIKLLDNRLANQIAAGEVVERPASVVKELMENCIDAGANKIEVDIERGGTRLIRITDNGKGIHKDDLALSLTRHATSKIQTTQDLACIQSLGFRGEALASISAVSRLTLTSRTHDSELAWQAIAHGRDMSVEILPAAAAAGTRIEVADLFFNTPARQKFLRAEKTEFNHVEEVFKRHALANFETAFVLKHNHKIVKRVPACGESSQQLKRLSIICGKSFADNCLAFECNHESIHIAGWLGKPEFHRSESDIQYVFINGRPVKDKTLNHAIRQAYEGLLPPGRMAAYVVFLVMDPTEVDVNVHPTKHEVRFGEQRLVHDLLAKSITDSLASCTAPLLDRPEDINLNAAASFEMKEDGSEINQPQDNYAKAPKYFTRERTSYQSAPSRYMPGIVNESLPNELVSSSSAVVSSLRGNSDKSSELLHVGNEYCLTNIDSTPIAINIKVLLEEYLHALLTKTKTAENKSLLFPKLINLASNCIEEFEVFDDLQSIGFVLEPVANNQAISQAACQGSNYGELLVKKIPLWLSQKDSSWIFDMLPLWGNARAKSRSSLVSIILENLNEMPLSLTDFLVEEMSSELISGNSSKKLTVDQMHELFK